MVAQAVAFALIVVPGRQAWMCEEVKLVNEADALEHIERAIDGNAMNVGINFLGAIEDGSSVEVLIPALIHHLN